MLPPSQSEDYPLEPHRLSRLQGGWLLDCQWTTVRGPWDSLAPWVHHGMSKGMPSIAADVTKALWSSADMVDLSHVVLSHSDKVAIEFLRRDRHGRVSPCRPCRKPILSDCTSCRRSHKRLKRRPRGRPRGPGGKSAQHGGGWRATCDDLSRRSSPRHSGGALVNVDSCESRPLGYIAHSVTKTN